MDPSMSKPVMASHHWSKVIRRSIIMVVIAVVAYKGFFNHLYPWAQAEYHQAFDTEPPKSDPSSNTVTVTGNGNVTVSGSDEGMVQQDAPPAKTLQLVVKKQTCIVIEAGAMLNDKIEVRVVNRCNTERRFVVLTVKARDSNGVVVKADRGYISSGEYIDVGEKRIYQLTFERPPTTSVVELAVDPGMTSN